MLAVKSSIDFGLGYMSPPPSRSDHDMLSNPTHHNTSRDLAEMLVADLEKAMNYLDKDHAEQEALVKKAGGVRALINDSEGEGADDESRLTTPPLLPHPPTR